MTATVQSRNQMFEFRLRHNLIEVLWGSDVGELTQGVVWTCAIEFVPVNPPTGVCEGILVIVIM